MRSSSRYSAACLTTGYAVATGSMLAASEVGFATEPVAVFAALAAGIPWPLTLRCQLDPVWAGVCITLTAMALNIVALWWWVGRTHR